METLVIAHSAPHGHYLVIFAVIVASGGIDRAINRSLLAFYSLNLLNQFRADLPAQLEGTATRKQGWNNVKEMKREIRRVFKRDLVKEFRNIIDDMEAE